MRGVDLSGGTQITVPACLLLLVSLGAALLSGCGSAEYERRLKASEAYFAYVQNMDANLSSPWSGHPVIHYRVPKQFTPIAGASEDAAENAPDPRQPRELGIDMDIELPGLVGAWMARETVKTADGSESVSSYMYVLSNFEFFTLTDTEERRAAATFNEDLVSQVASALGAPRPESDKWNELRVPVGDGYVDTKTYDEVAIKSETPAIGVPTQASLYLYTTGDIQVAILFITPRDPDVERINLSLETLEVSSETPQGAASSSGSGDAAHRSGGASF